jgi:hypothetical protein
MSGGGNYDLRPVMTLNHLGNVGVGTTAPSEKFVVNGNIKAQKIIISQTGWPDYVFDSSYTLRSLSEMEKFIAKINGYLICRLQKKWKKMGLV